MKFICLTVSMGVSVISEHNADIQIIPWEKGQTKHLIAKSKVGVQRGRSLRDYPRICCLHMCLFNLNSADFCLNDDLQSLNNVQNQCCYSFNNILDLGLPASACLLFSMFACPISIIDSGHDRNGWWQERFYYSRSMSSCCYFKCF